MAKKSLASYTAGVADAAQALGLQYDGDVERPDEDAGELDMTEYMRGQINMILECLAQERKARKSTANAISCMLNGIKPD